MTQCCKIYQLHNKIEFNELTNWSSLFRLGHIFEEGVI